MTGFRGATAVVGVGTTAYLRRGTSELSSAQLVLSAILDACRDAGADPRHIDGFVSYAGDSSEGLSIGAALATLAKSSSRESPKDWRKRESVVWSGRQDRHRYS